ncbi:hypothetical protein G9A89_000850 [Geosiphon pyriformis]|nr:hypothetical protein G9A89_000850 [Geosiphon pyriformis]
MEILPKEETVPSVTTVANAQIYKATYSGVPVWEMRCKGIAVMRRKSDGWLNATQILKVADFDKPHRTRILEREVQKGEHEKVQGGYGKYQGTWVPFATGVELAERYKVKELLSPIFDFTPSVLESPPLAPKHITAASNKPRKPREPKEPKAIKPKVPKKTKKAAAAAALAAAVVVQPVEEIMSLDTDIETNDANSITSPISNFTVSEISSMVTTPAPMVESSNEISDDDNVNSVKNKTKRRRHSEHGGRPAKVIKTTTIATSEIIKHYGEQMLRYFTTNVPVIPEFIKNPPIDFDPNVVVDQQAHVALHWAAAMANMEVAKLLLKAGADVERINMLGETALMRAVMFPYNYENKCFPQMLSLLESSIASYDHNDQTVLHHIAIYAGTKGRVAPSRYYMEILLARITQGHDAYKECIINMKNNEGDTALNIAARNANKKLVKLLLEAGGDPQIKNKENKNAEDYILKHENEARSRAMVTQSETPVHNGINDHNHMASSSTAQLDLRKSLVSTASLILHDFQESYEERLQRKSKELLCAQAELHSAEIDLQAANTTLQEFKSNAENLPAVQQRVVELQRLLREALESRRAERLQELYEEELRKLRNTTVDVSRMNELRKKLSELKQSHNASINTLMNTLLASESKLAKYKRIVTVCTGLQPQKLVKKIDLVLESVSSSSSTSD